jgi:hypothetical protein
MKNKKHEIKLSTLDVATLHMTGAHSGSCFQRDMNGSRETIERRETCGCVFHNRSRRDRLRTKMASC